LSPLASRTGMTRGGRLKRRSAMRRQINLEGAHALRELDEGNRRRVIGGAAISVGAGECV
jgi:hypothetical protein